MNYKNRKVVLKKRPVGFPRIDDFEIKSEIVQEINYGEVLVKILWLSLDPYMRGRMSEAKSYAPPIKIGSVITGGAVGEVIVSKCPYHKEGDMIEGFTLGWQEYAIVNTNLIRKVDTTLAPIQTAVGVLGMPGMTAYFGLFEVCKPVPGDNVVVSAASGAVGQLVGQLAKIAGCNVIGIAGNDKKCGYIKENLKTNDILHIESDKSRFWEENSLAVYYKEFKLGYLNSSINKVVQKMINKHGEVKVILKNKPKGHNPFEGIDILIQIG